MTHSKSRRESMVKSRKQRQNPHGKVPSLKEIAAETRQGIE
ncbi:DUF6254 family protein [Paenibacillus sp. FJAT-26967]|nr:DUF6254 family protein [Paenibacillus sp. FJAT-26967]